jgi:hypothetical protein
MIVSRNTRFAIMHLLLIVCLTFALSGCGNSDDDEPISPPATPTGLSIDNLDACQLWIWWEPNQDADVTGYNIYRRHGTSGDFTPIETNLNATEYVDEGLDCEETYYYQITAVNKYDYESDPTEAVYETTENFMPERPENLRINAHNWPDFGELYIMVRWNLNPETDIEGYEIHRGTTQSNIALYDSTDAATGSYEDVNVDVDQKYYYQVRAFDGMGLRGTLTEPKYDTPLSAAALDSPDDGAQVTDDTPLFSWEDVFGETQYRVMIGTSKVNIEGVWSVLVEADQTSVVYSGEEPLDGDYYWAVATVTNSITDWNSLSEIRTFTVQ